jgi:hypothetical protein
MRASFIRRQGLRIAAMVMLALVSFVPTAAVRAAGNVTPIGGTYDEWGARWWQWAYGIPAAVNPLFDETGAQCGQGQSGPVWYLAGVYNASGTAVRNCNVPAGTALFFPVLNAEDDRLCPANNDSLQQLRSVAGGFTASATDLRAEVDGVPISGIAENHATAARSPVFQVDFPADNMFSGCGVAAGRYQPFVDDGYYVMISPPAAGAHTLHFHGSLPAQNFTLDITYHLMIGG